MTGKNLSSIALINILKKAGVKYASSSGSWGYSSGVSVTKSTGRPYAEVHGHHGNHNKENPYEDRTNNLLSAANALKSYGGFVILMKAPNESVGNHYLVVYPEFMRDCREMRDDLKRGLIEWDEALYLSWHKDGIAEEKKEFQKIKADRDKKLNDRQTAEQRRMQVAKYFNPRVTALPRVILSDTLRVFEVYTMRQTIVKNEEGEDEWGPWKDFPGFLIVRWEPCKALDFELRKEVDKIKVSFAYTSDYAPHHFSSIATFRDIEADTVEQAIYQWLSENGDF